MTSIVGKTIARVDYGLIEFTDGTVLYNEDGYGGLTDYYLTDPGPWTDWQLITQADHQAILDTKAAEEAEKERQLAEREAKIAVAEASMSPSEFKEWYEQHYGLKGAMRVMKEVWTDETMIEALHGPSLLDRFKKEQP